jgi:hypothetical protein
MRISLKASGLAKDGLVDFVNRRAATGLGRFSNRVHTVTVRLQDLNGPKGGIDKRCTIEVTGDFGHRLVETRDQTSRAAIDRAFITLQRSIIRAVQRAAMAQRATR